MDRGAVVFRRRLERAGAGPMDWMEPSDTREESESDRRQQPVLDCAAMEGAALGLACVRSGDETIEGGLARALRLRADVGRNVYRQRAVRREMLPSGELAR